MKRFLAILTLVSTLFVSCRREPIPNKNIVNVPVTSAHALYYGDFYDKGTDNYDLVLEGRGMSAMLELNAPVSANMTLASGRYVPVLNANDPWKFTFLTGCVHGGSYVFNGDNFQSYINDGIVTVSVRGMEYVISASVVSNDIEYVFNYSGTLTVEKGEIGGDGELVEVVNNNLTQGYMEYWGSAWDNQASGTTDWVIDLATKDYKAGDSKGLAVMLEIIASGTSKTAIPEGTYTVTSNNAASFKALDVIPGIEQDDSVFGTWYIDTDPRSENYGYAVYGATRGTVKVSRTGDEYKIDYDLYDDDYLGHFSGSYKGKLNFVDASSSAAPSKAHRGQVKSRRK